MIAGPYAATCVMLFTRTINFNVGIIIIQFGLEEMQRLHDSSKVLINNGSQGSGVCAIWILKIGQSMDFLTVQQHIA